MQAGPVLAALLLTAIPLWVHPSWIVAGPSLAAGALLIFSALRWSSGSATTGGGLAIAAYALALWSSPDEAGLFAALLFGLALLPVIQYAAFARAFRGAELTPAVWRLLHRRWLVGGAAALATLALFAGGALLAAFGVPPLVRPILAGTGAVLALWAALATLSWRDSSR